MSKKEKILLIIIAVLAIIAGFFIFREGETDNDRLDRNKMLTEQELQHYTNKLDEKISQIEAKVYTQEEFRKFEKKALERIEEISGEVSEVSEYIKFSGRVRDTVFIQTDTTIYIVDKQGDQVKDFPFSYTDKWMDLDGSVRPDGTKISYEYRPSYEIVASWKKPEGAGLFARKRLLVDITAENPNEIITDAEAIEVQQPKVPFYETKGFWASLSYVLGLLTKILVQ